MTIILIDAYSATIANSAVDLSSRYDASPSRSMQAVQSIAFTTSGIFGIVICAILKGDSAKYSEQDSAGARRGNNKSSAQEPRHATRAREGSHYGGAGYGGDAF
jgi:hypothetical protein